MTNLLVIDETVFASPVQRVHCLLLRMPRIQESMFELVFFVSRADVHFLTPSLLTMNNVHLLTPWSSEKQTGSCP